MELVFITIERVRESTTLEEAKLAMMELENELRLADGDL